VEVGADLVVALQRGPDLLDLDLVDAVDAVGPPLGVLAQQQLHVQLQDVGDLVHDGELVEPAHAPLDLVDPALGLAEAVREDLLGHLPTGTPVRHAAADRQLVHVRSPPPTALHRNGERVPGDAFGVTSHVLCGWVCGCAIR
jgi:hypothetical protein